MFFLYQRLLDQIMAYFMIPSETTQKTIQLIIN
jgi:hypothetical protein